MQFGIFEENCSRTPVAAGPLGYGTASQVLGFEHQHIQSLLATNMQSGRVNLCLTLCKLMRASVNHKPCLKALCKGQAHVAPPSQQSL